MPEKIIKQPNHVTKQSVAYVAPTGFKKVTREPDVHALCKELNKNLPNQHLLTQHPRYYEDTPVAKKSIVTANKKTVLVGPPPAFKNPTPSAKQVKIEYTVEYYGSIL
jgi:hypothetical protein